MKISRHILMPHMQRQLVLKPKGQHKAAF